MRSCYPSAQRCGAPPVHRTRRVAGTLLHRRKLDRLGDRLYAEPFPIGEFAIDLPRPRVVQEIRFDPRFTRLYEQIWEALRTEVAEAYARTTRLQEVAS